MYKAVKEKLYIFRGADLSHSSPFSLVNKMANSENAYEIGNSIDGFCHRDISKILTAQITGEEKEINIIIDAHGGPGLNQTKAETEYIYYLQTQKKELIDFRDFLSEILKATGQVPLKIFITSCYGKNAQNHLDMLPVGSLMITLSGRNDGTVVSDSAVKGMMISTLDEIIYEQGFNIKYLLQAYCASQMTKQYNPVIGIHTQDGVKTLKVGDYIKDYVFSNCQKSHFVEKMVSNCIISNEQVKELTMQVEQGDIIRATDIKPKLSLSMLSNKLKTLSIPELKEHTEEKYYFKGSLPSLSFIKLKEFHKLLTELKNSLPESSDVGDFIQELLVVFQSKHSASLKYEEIVLENFQTDFDTKKLSLYTEKCIQTKEYANSITTLIKIGTLAATQDISHELLRELFPLWLQVQKEQLEKFIENNWINWKEWLLTEPTVDDEHAFANTMLNENEYINTINSVARYLKCCGELDNIFFSEGAMPKYNLLQVMASEEAMTQAIAMLGENTVADSWIDHFA